MDNAFASIYIRIFTKRYSSLIQKFSGVSIIDKNPSPSVHTDLVGIKLAQPGTLTHRYSFHQFGTATKQSTKGSLSTESYCARVASPQDQLESMTLFKEANK